MARPTVPDADKARTVPLRLVKPQYRALQAILEITGDSIQEQLRMAAKDWIEKKRRELNLAGVEFPSEYRLGAMTDDVFNVYVAGYGKGERLLPIPVGLDPKPGPKPAPRPRKRATAPTAHRYFDAFAVRLLELLRERPDTVFDTDMIVAALNCPRAVVPPLKAALLDEGHAEKVAQGHGRGAIRLAQPREPFNRQIKPVNTTHHRPKSKPPDVKPTRVLYNRAFDIVCDAGPEVQWTPTSIGNALKLKPLGRKRVEQAVVRLLIDNEVLRPHGDHLRLNA